MCGISTRRGVHPVGCFACRIGALSPSATGRSAMPTEIVYSFVGPSVRDRRTSRRGEQCVAACERHGFACNMLLRCVNIALCECVGVLFSGVGPGVSAVLSSALCLIALHVLGPMPVFNMAKDGMRASVGRSSNMVHELRS